MWIKGLHLTLLACLVLMPYQASAHSRGESYSKWQISSESVALTYTLKLKDINKLAKFFDADQPDWQQRVSEHVGEKVRIFSGSQICDESAAVSFSVANGYLQVKKIFACQQIDNLKIVNDGIFDFDSRHMHISRVKFENGDIAEKVVLARDREWRLYEQGAADGEGGLKGSTFYSYLILGAEHIASGWDHLAFLATIMLLILAMGGTGKTVFLLLSGFTLGHSVSLILMVLGFLSPEGQVVEALIAFSISLLAIEIVAFKKQAYLPLALAGVLFLLVFYLLGFAGFPSAIPTVTLVGLAMFVFCYFILASRFKSTTPQLLVTMLFGLVHGFGFAGSLQEIGFPDERLIPALLGFNIGVEIGQILIVLVSFLILAVGLRLLPFLKKEVLQEFLIASLCGLGFYWFIERSLF